MARSNFESKTPPPTPPSVPVGVMNILLGYTDYSDEYLEKDAPPSDRIAGHATVPLVNTLFHSIQTKRLRMLLTATVSGQPAVVKAILNENPSLILSKLEEKEFLTAPTGHPFNLTPYQAALAVDDTQMAGLIKSYFADEKQANAQYKMLFHKKWKEEEAKTWTPILTQLNALTQSFRHAKDSDFISSGKHDYKFTLRAGSDVAEALARFRLLMDATLHQVVTNGRFFNPKLLQRAFKIYERDQKSLGNWQNPRALLFWQQTIGYIQRFMPVNYAQAFCDGFKKTNESLEQGLPQGRSLILAILRPGIWHINAFYPLGVSSLGSDFAIGQTMRVNDELNVGQAFPFFSYSKDNALTLSLYKYVRIKNRERAQLYCPDSRQALTRRACSIR